MRNPFRLRAAQRAVSDEEFVRLFGAGVLDLMDDIADPWGGLVFLRSAPGGGKTSFLRLLTPRPLKIASMLHDDENGRPTYDALQEREAIGEKGPNILGVFCAFTNEYRDLEEVDLGGGMFRALLNARIVIATVRSLLERSDRAYPGDLSTIKASWTPDTDTTIPAEATGAELFAWASEIERNFYAQLDDLDDVEVGRTGHTRLDVLQWFSKAKLEDDHGVVEAKRVLLLDDLQFLTEGQRSSLKDILTQARANCGIWVAERMEALSHQELLSEGALENRDYQGVIQLENKWSRRLPAYTKFVSQIAELRARRADSFSDRDMFSMIAEQDDEAIWRDRFEFASTEVRSRVKDLTGNHPRYNQWMMDAEQSPGNAFQKATNWRTTQILVERDLARSQGTLGFDVLTAVDFKDRASSAMAQAAELFLRKEIDAPLYFGKSALAGVSSTNVDQYVDVAGDLFEEISASIAGPRISPPSLTTERQHSLIKTAAERRWVDMPRRLPQGYDARRLLEAVATYCQQQTYRATAPYAPGVTGFAITMEDRARLIDDTAENPILYIKLRDILTTLVAHNLLTPRLDHKNKGQSFVVFYLNRLTCVRFDLPLGYGGWRERSLKELSMWLQNGAEAVREDRLV